MNDRPLSAVVEKPRAQAAIGSLRAEGVYDDDRSVYECGSGTVAIPVTAPPAETAVLEVIRDTGEPRLRTLADHLRERGWSDDELDRAPGSWAVIGSVVLVKVGDAPRPEEVGEALLAMHGEADTVLAREGIDGEHREPSVTVLAGEGDTETVHREHGTTYALDLAAVMFSPGNKAERARMGEVVTADERVLDMFAGIGYFTLPMARAGARVTAVERNPASFEYLVENVVRNGVQETVETYRADCRDVIAGGIEAVEGDGGDRDGDGTPFAFDRIVMGYYDAHEYLDSALSALAPGGVVHMHEATPEALVPERPISRLEEAAEAVGREVEVLDTRQVKGYSEGVAHVVVDARIE
ncbi:class I SAM-dependent methyltransferase family protein [Halobacteriales archaeon SW_10_66_29]|nr:MAG: class I SAM-dependent methyltransferase family protein [Halobacteriales archaeon SW_10_66_29]